jgi:hypothetical protein
MDIQNKPALILTEMKKELKLEEAKEKFGEKNVRKIFEIQIREEMYPVYSIEGYEHQLGKSNGCPDTWWLDYSDYNTVVERDGTISSPIIRELVPYIDKGVHRTCWGIDYQQYNTTKYKWDEWDIRNGGICKISANGKPVYKFHYRDLQGALAAASSKIDEMMNHPFDFIHPETEEGRKIWYYGLPAIIKLGYEPGEIRIKPDYSYMTSTEWWNELEKRQTNVTPKNRNYIDDEKEEEERDKERFEETKDYGEINHGSVFYDGMINWFRHE